MKEVESDYLCNCTIFNATDDPNELALFIFEAQGCGALDMACTSSVAGKKWFTSYMRLLGEDRDKIIFDESSELVANSIMTRWICYLMDSTMMGVRIQGCMFES